MPRTGRAAVGLMALALVMAACGTSDEDVSDTTATAEPGETETAPATETAPDGNDGDAEASPDSEEPELDEVTIMLGGHAMSWASTYVAQEQGFFEEEGVTVEIVASPEGAPSAIAAVVSNSVFLTFSGAAGQISAIIEGAPVKWPFVSALGLAPEMCATPEWLNENGLDASSALEDKLAALPGSRLAIFNPGDNLEQLYRFLWGHFELGDIDSDGTELLNLSNLSGTIAAAAQGQVDVMASTPPGCQVAQAEGVAEIFLRPMEEVEALAIMPASVAMANERTFEEHPNTLKAIIRAVSRGNAVLHEDPETAWPIIQAQFSETDEEELRATFEQHLEVRAPDELAISEDQWDAFVRFRDLQGEGVGDVTYEDAVNPTIAQEVAQEVAG